MSEQRVLKVGDSASVTRSFSADDVKAFAHLSGDHNPVHLDAEFAATTSFGRCVCHGALVTSLFSTLLGTELPGKGAIYVSQESKFRAPVFPDEQITAEVEITAINERKPMVTLKTTVTNAEGKAVVRGEAVMFVPWLQQ
ncbi:MAG: MaoC family dehydratase [Thiolinea sp.]